jgi:hypothetical protein
MKGIGEGKRGKRIFSFTWISLIIPITFIAGTLFIASCTKTYEFNIGEDFLEAQTRLQVIDTFRANLSTVLLDSLTTSSAETVFVGNYQDTIFGSIRCESYFDLAYESFPIIEEKAIFDSSAFILSYKGSSYGDTASLMSVSIHELTENIEPFDNGYLYNNTSFDYNPEPAGILNFYPEPNSLSDTAISISVNALGEELFTLIRNKDERVSSEVWFKDYLKGFILTPGISDNKAIIGFEAGQGVIVLKIYYHLDKEEPEKKELSVKAGKASNQFNNVSYNFTNTFLSEIQMQGYEMPSSMTGYKGYMQGLIGLLPKIRFPSLKDILLAEKWKILKAELIIDPVKWSYDVFKLPEKLYIYDTDKENRINSVLRDDDNNALTAFFMFDEIYGEETRYTFDITTFINNELADAYFDYEHGLLLGLEQKEYTSSLDRLFIEGKNPPVKLRLYYLSY